MKAHGSVGQPGRHYVHVSKHSLCNTTVTSTKQATSMEKRELRCGLTEWDALRASGRVNKYTPGRGKVRFASEGMRLYTHVFISHAR